MSHSIAPSPSSVQTSRTSSNGFTLIELMIVIAIIAIIAAIAIPNLIAARLSANETAAMATLRTMISAQAQIQQKASVDTDNDGTGEYGGFMEMSGAIPGRMNARLVPPVLSGSFRFLNVNGEFSRSGYLFRVHLPNGAGVGVGEPAAGFADDGTVAADAAESAWCCYAWPVAYNQSGNRTFFANQSGDITFTESSAYASTGAGPTSDAAYAVAGAMTGRIAIGGAGADGNTWKQAQ